MLEIEIKYRVDDFAPVVAALTRLSAAHVENRDDVDAYFNAPHRDFAVTDEALRIRRIGNQACITYKGPRTDQQTKTREEIEAPLADGVGPAADMERILAALGFRPTAIVRKTRSVFELTRGRFLVHVCLDEVAEVGAFVELEIVADQSAFTEAKAELLACAAELGLAQMERRSYLEMLLESRQR